MLFTKRKFLEFSIKKQHKKCSEILSLFFKNAQMDMIAHYNEIQGWMGLSPLEEYTKEAVSNRFHIHINQGNCFLREDALLPSISTIDRSTPLFPPLPISIYLDNLRSSHNIGSIIRTVEAFSLGSIYFSTSSSLNKRQIEKTAMGAMSHVPCHENSSLDTLPKPVIVLETCPDALDINSYIFPESFTLVVGNEEYGVSQKTLEIADQLLTIPLRGRKNSINVANAFAIVAAKICEQKGLIS